MKLETEQNSFDQKKGKLSTIFKEISMFNYRKTKKNLENLKSNPNNHFQSGISKNWPKKPHLDYK